MPNKIIKVTNNSLEVAIKVSQNGYYEVSYKKYNKTRSTKQNRYYWGVVIPHLIRFFEAKGVILDQDMAHLQFKDMVGWFSECLVMDVEKSVEHSKEIFKSVKNYRSFSDAGDIETVEFMEAVEIVRQAILEYSNGEFEIPLPRAIDDAHF